MAYFGSAAGHVRAALMSVGVKDRVDRDGNKIFSIGGFCRTSGEPFTPSNEMKQSGCKDYRGIRGKFMGR